MKYKISLSLFLLTSFSFSPSAYSDEESSGNYKVPVDSAELEPSSTYEAQYKIKMEQDEITRIKCKLPLELSGEENEIDISYTGDAEFPWSGELARGDCQEKDGRFNCQLNYSKEKLIIDVTKTEAAITARFSGNPEELQRRLKVAEIFRSEPAGITSFPLQYDPEE